jgi:hypothetical protein
MALRSKLFAGDRKLAAAQVSDPAHLVRGTVGPHVNKVQMALFAIDALPIDAQEFRRKIYGPMTARAVLAYKTRRKIINRAYQQKPDDIVGKMTITRLDEDMVRWEASHRHVDDCSLSGRGSRAPASVAAVKQSSPRTVGFGARGIKQSESKARTSTAAKVGETTGAKPQLGGALRVILAITNQAALAEGFPIEKHIQVARDLLFEYGITLDTAVTSGFADRIDFAQSLVLDEDIALLRQAWEVQRPGLPSVLRVVVAQGPINGNHGNTYRGVMVGSNAFRPFVVLNSRVQRANKNTTLLHEMIHASYPGPVDHDDEEFSIFYDHRKPPSGLVDQRMLREDRARQLVKGFFAVGAR